MGVSIVPALISLPGSFRPADSLQSQVIGTKGLVVSWPRDVKRCCWLVLATVCACSFMMVDGRLLNLFLYRVTEEDYFGEWRLRSNRSRVQPGMAKVEVYSILGKPLGTGPEYDGRGWSGSSEVWQNGRISFYVHFDDKERVKRTETVDISD